MSKNIISRIWPFVVCSFASFFYFYVYVVHVMPSAMTDSLMTTFGIQAAGLGILSSLYFYGYTPMQIPAGILYDKFGARTLLTTALGLCALSTLAFGLTHFFPIALFARWIMGITAAFGFVGALVVGAAWFPVRYFATYTGLVQLLGCIGAILGQGPVASLTNLLGWRETAVLISFVGLIFAFLIWLVIRNAPPGQTSHIHSQKNTTKKISSREVFKKSQNWWIALFSFGIWGPVVTFAALWGVPFFHDVYHISTVEAASLTSFVWIGIAVGGPFLGWWSYRSSKRLTPMFSAALVGIIAAFFLLYVNHLPFWILIILLIGIGIGSSAQALSFGIINDLNQKEILGTAIGFTNMAIVAGGLVLQPIVGVILESLHKTQIINGVPIYPAYSYKIALVIVPMSFLLALIATIFIKETNCHHQYD